MGVWKTQIFIQLINFQENIPQNLNQFKRKERKTFEATHVIKHKESFPFLQEIFLPYQNSTNICLIKNNFIPQKYHLLLIYHKFCK